MDLRKRLIGGRIYMDENNPKIKKHNYNQPLPENKYNPLAWISPEAVIGNNCWIGSDVVITKNVEIGDNVSVSCGCKIYDHDTSFYRSSEGAVKEKHYKVKIGSFTHIGSNSVIIPKDKDIVIGDHVIIGALSLVKTSVPPYTIVAGIPATVIGDVKKYDTAK